MAAPITKSHPPGIVRVGSGRGFVVKGEWNPLVITAAHCLPKLPKPTTDPGAERTYPSLLGKLGKKPTVWTECLFANPIDDIAVLGPVDDQVFFDGQPEAYEELVSKMPPFQIADAPPSGSAWLYSLDGHWFPAKIKRLAHQTEFRFYESTQAILDGMSGSPIRNQNGQAIGLVSFSTGELKEAHHEGFAGMLTRTLPVWLVRQMKHPVLTCHHCGLDGFHENLDECIQALDQRANDIRRNRTHVP
jgi:hypothetical protein